MSNNNPKNPIIVVLGPTASGKSELAIEIAKRFNGEIISADSAQIYKELQIITARATPEEMDNIPHYFSGFMHLGEDFSVSAFQQLAFQIIKKIVSLGKLPILVGGTNLYIKAILEAYDFPDVEPDMELRKQLEKKANEIGKEEFYKILKKKDPSAAMKIHPNNLRRVIRAMEIIEKTGKPFSGFYNKTEPHPVNLYPFIISIEIDRQILYNRINYRTEKMFSSGAIEEVNRLVKKGNKDVLLKSKILGVEEVYNILSGNYSIDEGKEILKKNTRRYAKRQLTWLRTFSKDFEYKSNLLEEKERLFKKISQFKENIYQRS